MIIRGLHATLYVLLALTPAVAFAQRHPQIKFQVRVSDASDSAKYLYMGVDSTATKAIDPALGEVELPPVPPLGGLDARCSGDSIGVGSMVDLRRFFSYTQTDTFLIRFQPSTRGGYPMKFRWSKAFLQEHYQFGVRMTDPLGPGGTVVNVDMKTVDSAMITNTLFNTVRVIASGPIAPNSITGSVYDDLNGSGLKGASEPPLGGWTVYLNGTRSAVTTTNVSGTYVFDDLPTGNYVVTGALPPGWIRTYPAGPPDSLSLGIGEDFDNGGIGNFKLGSIAGLKFIDADGSQTRDPGEETIPHWKIYIHGDAEDSALTDLAGGYLFAGLGPGTYTIAEQQGPDWVQLLPGSPGYYTVVMTSGLDTFGLEFGNKAANKYVGAPSGTWSDSTHWLLGRPPGPKDAVVLDVPVVVDSLTENRILAIRIASGGELQYATSESLIVRKSLQIETGGKIVFPDPPAAKYGSPSFALQPQIICYGDWMNRGLFTPGGSLVTMAGDFQKSIMNTTFYDLEIRGNNTISEGTIGVLNTLYLFNPLGLADDDTLTVFNPRSDAVVDTGSIPRGTIRRAIQSGETSPYRFANPLTMLLFTAGSGLPDFVAMTCHPDTVSALFALDWEVVGGTVDTGANTIYADTVRKFSKWALGTPKPTSIIGEPRVNRLYTISPSGGTDYAATLKLSYDQSEVRPGTDETTLKLLRDPQVLGEVYRGWNMVSVPLDPPNHARDQLFPASISTAYRYAGSYLPSPTLEFGTGYWLKFPEDSLVLFQAYDSEVNTIPVSRGWNIIGTIGLPVDPASIVSDPPGNIRGGFYAYHDGYSEADVLLPVHAYFMRAKAVGTITLRAGAAPVNKGEARPDDASMLSSLTVRDRAGREQVLYYTSDPAADRDWYALPPLPPQGAYDVRFASGFGMVQSSVDSSETPINVAAGEYPLTVAWDARDEGVTAALVLDGREYPMAGKGSVAIPAPESRAALRLSIRSVTPEAFALRQCYPNPFNPVTTIEYELPSRQDVVIRVFNLLGQEVATLHEGTREAGVHRTRFDASPLASGIYFYRIQAGPYSAVMKMALVR
jgi:hypothetical protein